MKRLTAVLLQVVFCVQAGFVAAVIPAASVVPTAAAAGACTVATGATGGIVSACANADTYDDLVSELKNAFAILRDETGTTPLSVTSQPAGASIELNGLAAGLTPLNTAVAPGTYLVRVSKAGFDSYSTSVQVGDSAAAVNAALNPVDDGPKAVYEWVHPATLIALAGAPTDCDFEIGSFVSDKAGDYYVSFSCFVTGSYPVDAPIEAPGYVQYTSTFRPTVRTSGVAKTTDKGQSWSLVHSWTDTFAYRAWTSERFEDGAPTTPAADGTKLASDFDHWVRAYYTETTSEIWSIWGLLPRDDGSVAILVNHATSHVSQAVAAVYDNAGPSNNPLKFFGANVTQLQTSGTYRIIAHPDMQARFGMSPSDLGTAFAVTTNENRRVGSTGTDVVATISGPTLYLTRPSYQGSFNGTDYFLGIGSQSSGPPDYNDYIFRSTDGGQTISLYKSLDIGLRGAEFTRAEELRIGPDGSLYLIDHVKGGVWAAEDAGPRLLGRAPDTLNYGVSGGNNTPYVSVDFDSAGNLMGAFRASGTPSDNSQMRVYYQFFPRQPITYSGVALLTQASCALCDKTAQWLTDAGVAYQLNPTNLPSDLAATAAAEAAQHGYPVLVRQGSNAVALGGADPVAAARLLAVSYPTLIDIHEPTVSNIAPASGPYGIAIEAQWIRMIVDNDRPHVILERRDGVGDLTAGDSGDWEFNVLMPSPPHIQDSASLQFSKRYPALPGGSISLGRMVTRQAPFNVPSVDDFVMLYNSEATRNGSGNVQRGYTMWRIDAGGATDSAYRAIADVSQLIPAAAFYVALGEHGTPGTVTGELADYVTSQQVVTDGTDRFYKVVVDLRAKNETATNGNIFSRGISGSVHVDTQTEDGDPDVRDISLIMLIGNTRLQTFDPRTRDASQDITTEAVHFTGADEHWVVTNNIGLPNEIPCGLDQSLLLNPFSTATFTAADVAGFDIGSCLAALEVTPTVIAQCDTWDDVKLVLAGDTIAALNGSLPINRSESMTNWELSYGSRSAQITRIVSFDRPIDALSQSGSCTASAGEIADVNAAAVGVNGPFIGSGAYEPTITVLDRGTAAILTAPKAQPGSLAWERRWLEFESTILEANLNLSIRDEAAVSVLFLDRVKKRIAYSRQLLATRALLHCNYEGVGVDEVRQLIARSAGTPGTLADTRLCLQSFVLNPKLHWPSYSPSLWLGGSYQADFVGSVISSGIDVNPTLAYLAASSDGTVIDYGEFLIPRAQALAGNGSNFSTDMELDHYARMATAASRELAGMDGRLLRAVLLSGQVERTAMNSLVNCARTMPGDKPIAKMIELTSQRAYQPGIPCVDARAGASRDQWFQLVGIALRSGTWGAISDAAGLDLDLALKLLDSYGPALTRATALEAQYPAGTTVARWGADLPPADRLEIAIRQGRVTQEERGHQIAFGELPQVLAGVAECGIGFVHGFFPDGLIIIAATGAAVLAGPAAAAAGGLIFVGFGAVVTGIGVVDLAQVWETLDLAAKTSGICGAAVGAVLTAAGLDGTINAVRSLTPADLRYSPPKMIDPNTVPSTGHSAGMTLEEQGEAMTPRGGDIEQPPAVATAPIDTAIQAAIDLLPAAERPPADFAVRKLNVDAMSPAEKTVITQLLESADRASRRDVKLFNLAQAGKRGTPEYVAWDVTGAAFVLELAKPLPKSIVAEPVPAKPATASSPATPAHISGTDAEIVKAVEDAGVPIEGILGNHDVNAVIARKGQLFAAVLDSERMLRTLQDPGFRPLATAAEANGWFGQAKAALSTTTNAFFTEIAGSRFVTAVKTGVLQAQQLAGMNGVSITALKSKLLKPGTNKVVVRLTATLSDGRTFDVAFAKGDITPPEAAIYSKYGPLEITQNLLEPLVENVDGTQSLLMTEYLPGLDVPPGPAGFEQLLIATSDADYAGAIGALEARIWLRTQDTPGLAIFNTDLHLGNMNVFVRNGLKIARAIDFDPQYDRVVAEDAYWVATLLRRNSNAEMGVLNIDGYLTSALDALANEPGSSRAAGLELLRRARADLDNPAIIDSSRSLVSDIDDLLVADTKASLDAFLAAQTPRALQFPPITNLFELAPAA